MIKQLLQGVLDYVRLKMLAVPAGVQTTPLPPDATVAQLAERVNQLTAALDAMLKADMIQGTRLLAQERLLEAPEPAPAMQLSGPMMEEMSSLQRMEFFRPRMLPPDASDETPEDVSTDEGSAGTAEEYARGDHVHYADIPDPSDTAPQDVTTGSASAGTGDDYSRADHVHYADIPVASTANPIHVQPDGNESPGAAATYARGDHRHALVLAPTGSTTGPGLSFELDEGVYKLGVVLDEGGNVGPLQFNGETGAIKLVYDRDHRVDAGPTNGLFVRTEVLVDGAMGMAAEGEGGKFSVKIAAPIEYDGGGSLTVPPQEGGGLMQDGTTGRLRVAVAEGEGIVLGTYGLGLDTVGSVAKSVEYTDANGDPMVMDFDAHGRFIDNHAP